MMTTVEEAMPRRIRDASGGEAAGASARALCLTWQWYFMLSKCRWPTKINSCRKMKRGPVLKRVYIRHLKTTNLMLIWSSDSNCQSCYI